MNAISIILIIVAVVLIYFLVKYLTSNTNSLQSGVENGQNPIVIPASSLATSDGAAPSNFAYSSWFYVNDWNYRYGQPKVLFGRMGAKGQSETTNEDSGISGKDPCPAVVFGAIENNLLVSLACFPGEVVEDQTAGTNTIVHTCSVANIPIQKWVHLTVSVYMRTMDIYIDGKLVKTCLLPGTANVNNAADLHITPSGGFDGWTTKLSYFPHAMNPQDVWNIYAKGPLGWMSSMPSYHVQVSLVENGTTQSSVTL
jgi:hypothetical protein